MKQFVTIFFISIVFLLQYGKYASYYQCKIINAAQEQNCDCEKILTDNNTDTNHEKLPSVLKLNIADEMFVESDFSITIPTQQNIQKPTGFINPFFVQHFLSVLIQPPARC